jgi:hypothetical protein
VAVGELITQPYTVEDGLAYLRHLEQAGREAERLVVEGRLPDTDEVAQHLRAVARAQERFQRDIAAAQARGETTVVSRFERSPSQHARLRAMAETVETLLEVLELRQAADLGHTDGSRRVARALRDAVLVP